MTRTHPHFNYFEHDADIGIEAQGKTLEEAFESAALAMFAIMAHPATVMPERQVRLEFEEADVELALATWLNQLLAQTRLKGLVFCAFALKREGNRWNGEAWGMPWKPGGDQSMEVKEATLTLLKVEQTARDWRVRCVVAV
jgi:SHS2 domain-containing protein